MQLQPGVFVGPYQVVGLLGAGGMGEVYRARDPRLGRDVAIKILSSPDPSDRGYFRFQQEARAVAALNHPNVVAVFDVGTHEARPYLVSEMLQGETLRQMLRRGPLPLRKTIEYGIETARGLAAAHAKGIVHRDLKPENIFVTSEGRIKILDFGVAKLRPAAAEPDDATNTLNTAPDQRVGTVPYMAPEYLQGQSADRRSDIFGLGAVLYEMIAGHRAFGRSTAAETTAAILRDEPPPLARRRTDARGDLDRIVRRCLDKQPGARFQSAEDVAFALEAVFDQIGRSPRPVRLGWIAGAAAVLALAAAITGLRFVRPSAGAPPPLRVSPLTSFPGSEFHPAFSSDGNDVAFVWDGEGGGNFDIYRRAMGSETTLRLTTDPAFDCCPTWSPDGRSIAFLRVKQTGGEIFTVPALGGVERKLKDVGVWFGSGLSWSPEAGLIAFVDRARPDGPFGISVISTASLEQRPLTAPSALFVGDGFPAFSPDGRALAFSRVPALKDTLHASELHVLDLETGKSRQLHDRIVVGGLDWTADSSALVIAGGPLLEYGLWKAPVAGGPLQRISLAQDPAPSNAPADALSEVSRGFRLAVSRKGDRLAFTRALYDTDIWGADIDAGGTASAPRKLIASTRVDEAPHFSPDGARIAFASWRSTPNPEIWISGADGSNPVQLTSLGLDSGTPRWSPDGRRIAFDSRPQGNSDIHVVDVDTRLVRRLPTGRSQEVVPGWSRDGRWIYFASDRSGSWQIWKQPSEGGAPVQVTTSGGFAAMESPDGQFLYYTKLEAGGVWRKPLAAGHETRVLDRPRCWGYWAVSSDGLFVLGEDVMRPTLELFRFPTNAPAVVARLPGKPSCGEASLAVSADGRKIAFVVAEQGSDLLLVEKFH